MESYEFVVSKLIVRIQVKFSLDFFYNEMSLNKLNLFEWIKKLRFSYRKKENFIQVILQLVSSTERYPKPSFQWLCFVRRERTMRIYFSIYAK